MYIKEKVTIRFSLFVKIQGLIELFYLISYYFLFIDLDNGY